jgi:hypothetical protein
LFKNDSLLFPTGKDKISLQTSITRGLIGDYSSKFIEYTGKEIEPYVNNSILDSPGDLRKRISPVSGIMIGETIPWITSGSTLDPMTFVRFL